MPGGSVGPDPDAARIGRPRPGRGPSRAARPCLTRGVSGTWVGSPTLAE